MIGTMFLCYNYSELVSFVRDRQYLTNSKAKVIVLDDQVIQQPDYITGSILLPPPIMLMDYIDYNNYNDFYNKYYSYLIGDEDVMKYIKMITSALFKGIDIILYLGESDPSTFLDILINVLCNAYGLIIFNAYDNGVISNALCYRLGSIRPNMFTSIANTLLNERYIDNSDLYSYQAPNSVFKYEGDL